jgi:hypothetical protein
MMDFILCNNIHEGLPNLWIKYNLEFYRWNNLIKMNSLISPCFLICHKNHFQSKNGRKEKERRRETKRKWRKGKINKNVCKKK